MSIILDKVSCLYSKGTTYETYGIRDINLKIEDGEFVGLIGHTGSGKSTLIQHMNGLIKPTSGAIYYNGQDIGDKDYNRKELRSKVGLVFQYPEYQLFETSVLKDVCFGPKNQGFSEKEAQLRAYQALKSVGISENLFYQSPFELSGGQKRRVAIAGVLAMEPEMLILDEPTAGLDPQGRDDILHLIQKLHDEKNITIILVTHSMEDVAEYVSRLVVLDEGSIRYDGTPHEIFRHHKELEQIGLMAPEVTYLFHNLREKGIPVSRKVTTVKEAKEEILREIGRSMV